MESITDGNLQRTDAGSHVVPASGDHGSITVAVNNKTVILTSHQVTGLAVKEAAIGQGVQIELDFLLTLEAFGGQPAKTIADDETIAVTKHSVFKANDGDDDS